MDFANTWAVAMRGEVLLLSYCQCCAKNVRFLPNSSGGPICGKMAREGGRGNLPLLAAANAVLASFLFMAQPGNHKGAWLTGGKDFHCMDLRMEVFTPVHLGQ